MRIHSDICYYHVLLLANFIAVKEMRTELIVPDLSNFKVSYCILKIINYIILRFVYS